MCSTSSSFFGRAASEKPTVLIFARFFTPAFKGGGPVRSISSMVSLLGNDVSFRIVTSDRDLGDKTPYDHLQRDRWIPVGKALVMYASPRMLRLRALLSLFKTEHADLLYINNFVHPVFGFRAMLAARMARFSRDRILVAPRGAFSEGALSIKRKKKRMYIAIVKAIQLCKGNRWQASSVEEARQIRQVMGIAENSISVVPNLTEPAALSLEPGWVPRSSGEPLRIVFLSRISPMKNLRYVIGILGRVRVPVALSIFGPIEDTSYWNLCRNEIEILPAHVATAARGPVPPQDVTTTLSRYDLFFLPTLGENFGHVIAEALSAGTPVLISDRTPWRDLENWGAGWDLSLSEPEAFVSRIEDVSGWDSRQQTFARRKTAEYARNHFGTQEAVTANLRLLLSFATGDGPRTEPTT